VIYEAFKPGTEPTGDPGPILGADDGGTVDASQPGSPGTVTPLPSASGVAAFPVPAGPRATVPGTGTGGLY
jgi:hypothetical protein